jgi:zinc-binding in reverse transcriptase
MYSAKSIYEMLSTIGQTRSRHGWIWHPKATPTIMIFGIFLLMGRLMTHNLMVRCNIPTDMACLVC